MNKPVALIGLITLLGFGIAGILVIEFFQEITFLEVWLGGQSLDYQLWKGGLSGLLASGVALFIISRKFFDKERVFYYKLIRKLEINLPGIIFLSLCAGIGEEIFFRAAIQPFLGIGLTSLLFVLLHGYLTPKNPRLSVYGLVMVVIVAGFGYLFKTVGLIAAITAHTVFDMVLFIRITGVTHFYNTKIQ